MIFSIGDHIKQIIDGTKTQTRRTTLRYQKGKTYSVQPCRTCKGIEEGRILILDIWIEDGLISKEDALAEGGYSREEFEILYEKIHPNWETRTVYKFRFIPK